LGSGEEQGPSKFQFRIRRGALCIEDRRPRFKDSGTELSIYIALLAGFQFYQMRAGFIKRKFKFLKITGVKGRSDKFKNVSHLVITSPTFL
jgi:hypothetical protein